MFNSGNSFTMQYGSSLSKIESPGVDNIWPELHSFALTPRKRGFEAKKGVCFFCLRHLQDGTRSALSFFPRPGSERVEIFGTCRPSGPGGISHAAKAQSEPVAAPSLVLVTTGQRK